MKIIFKINSKALDETCNCENPPASSLHCKASMEDLFGDRTCNFLHNNNPKHTMHNASVAQVHLISASEPYCIRTQCQAFRMASAHWLITGCNLFTCSERHSVQLAKLTLGFPQRTDCSLTIKYFHIKVWEFPCSPHDAHKLISVI